MATLQQFISHVSKHGLATTNRFRVVIPLPEMLDRKTANVNQEKTSSIFGSDVIKFVQSYVGSGTTEISRGLDIMVEESPLPAKTLATTEIKYNSDFQKIPYYNVYDDLRFSFRCSKDMYEKNIIDEWMNTIFNPVTHEIEYYDNYVTNITIEQLNNQDNVVYSVILKGAYPMICNEIPLSNNERDTYALLSVNFAYSRWIRVGEDEDLDESQSGLADALSQTPLGPSVTPILSNPAVERGLEVLEANTGIDLEGEAVNIYNQIDGIVRGTTGTSINKSISILNGIKGQISVNGEITDQQQAELIDIVDKILDKLSKVR